MKLALALPFVLLASLLATREAAAGLSFHERAEAKPIKQSGQVVGMRVKLTLRPDDARRPIVRIGVAPVSTVRPEGETHRLLASDPAKGHLVHQWPQIKLEPNELKQPKEITLEVRFADAPGLKPGADVELISAWHTGKEGEAYYHVWGMQAIVADKGSVLKVPSDAASDGAAAAGLRRAQVRRSRTQARRTQVRRTATVRRAAHR